MKRVVAATLLLSSAGPALAQVPYDPPTATKAAPNVFLIMDASRTTMINGSTCRGDCHEEGSIGGEHNGSIYLEGETRLQLARRVLTGGWGWNTSYVSGSNGPADGGSRQDGVMDQYKVRWGLIYYDGIGARFVLNPTAENLRAQQRVIDFGQPNFGATAGAVNVSTLNSWVPFWRTTRCCGNGMVWGGMGDNQETGARQARALYMLKHYLASTTDIAQWTPPDASASGFALGGDVENPNNSLSIYNDPANVLVNDPPAGCRRNFGIMLLDGHGNGSSYSSADSRFRAALDPPSPITPADAAREIHTMGKFGSTVTPLPVDKRNQVFAIHFGVQDYAQASLVADAGFDGVLNGNPLAFVGAPGGQITDLSPLYAAFASIFQLILDGEYLGAPPTITHQGDVEVVSTFFIQDCTQARPDQCNIGRIGRLRRGIDTNMDGTFDSVLDFGEVLRSRDWTTRKLYTSYNSTNANCGQAASTRATACASKTASMVAASAGSWPGNATIAGVAGSAYNFIKGDPNAEFSNTVARGDTRNGTAGALGNLTNPYKLMDIANSRPVVVSAPTGIGEDITRWNHFRNMSLTRYAANGGDGSVTTVSKRDEIVYIGGNDGMLHAFLSRRDTGGAPPPGRTVAYGTSLGNCATPAPPSQVSQSNCIGLELWGYTPRLLHPYWSAIRGGHYFMVDGTPVVSDVLLTKKIATPPAPTGAGACTIDNSAACGAQWEYRTVLLQCLGGGGPGCFALDVTNPYDPRLLWERSLLNGVTTRVASTSRPQIARMRHQVGGVWVPYYVGLMGGGLGEAIVGTRRASFIAVGLDDGAVYHLPSLYYGNGDFAGPPSCLDTNNDSFVDTCYVATTESDIYKVRFANGDPSQMTMSLFFDGRALLASRGLPGSTTIRSYNRVVASFDRSRDLRIFMGTGNFEDVQNTTESNYFFELTDFSPESASVATVGSACNNGAGAGVIAFGAREKMIFDPLISNGTVLFTTFAPNVNPCLPGDAALYGIDYDSCAPKLDDDHDSSTPNVTKLPMPGAGLPSAPVVNEAQGTVSVALDNGTVIGNAATIQRPGQLPVSKLWWRLVR